MTEQADDLKQVLNIAGDALVEKPDGTNCLIAVECGDCSERVFPPVAVCPECMSENMTKIELSGIGKLYSWSVVRIAPANWKAPFIAGYVDFPEGVRVFAHMVDIDPDELSFDMPVSVCRSVLGVESNGTEIESYSFLPIAEEN
jgi:uncharacterized OB-fold protein